MAHGEPVSPLEITLDGQSLQFEPSDAPIRVGRSREGDVSVADPSVSRVHLEIDHDGDGWAFRDVSSRGTFLVQGDRASSGGVDGEVALHLGRDDGPLVVLRSDSRSDRGAAKEPGRFDAAETASFEDTALRLEVDGRELVFTAPGVVTLGRGEGNKVVLSEQHSLVSRRHLAFRWVDGHWWIEDVGSSRGTFIDDRRIAGRCRADGVFHVLLGDAEAGTRMTVVTAGTHRKRRQLGPITVGMAIAMAVVALLAVLVAVAVSVSDGGGAGEGANTATERALAREATVMVELLDDDLTRLGFTGSGVLVTNDGLVLTNAHVAFSGTHGDRVGVPSNFPDVSRLAIGFASEDGGEVDRFYVAVPVALHPYHDAALVRIVADGNNNPDFDVPFDPLPLGTSADLRAGDLVDQFGFPGAAATLRVSVATRNFQSLAPCPGTPGDDCLAELDEGWLNLSGQPLGSGSSGGPIVRDGRLVGINQGTLFQPDRSVEQNRAVPIDLIAAELLSG